MTRRIKFRAWDTIDKRMRYEHDVEGIKEWPSLLAVGFHGLPIAIDGDSFKDDEIIGWNRDHNLILMQSTGLNDRIGREIYEGDIVRDEFGDKYRCEYLTDFAAFALTKDNYVDFVGQIFTERTDYYNWEVIGNIYEMEESE